MRLVARQILQFILAHFPVLAGVISYAFAIRIFKLDAFGSLGIFALTYFLFFGLSKFIQRRMKLLPQDILHELGLSVRASSNLMGSLENFSVNSNKQAIISQDIGKHLAEVSRAAQDILEKAKETSECSVKSQAAATDGGNSIQELLEFLRQVIESNQNLNRAMDEGNIEFGKIVSIIDQIQEKTEAIHEIVFNIKLLSFNASLEAGRAGDAGRGFNIVAEEIANLARSSGAVASEIDEIIESSHSSVEGIIHKNKTRVEEILLSVKKRIDAGSKLGENCRIIFQNISRLIEEMRERSLNVAKNSDVQAAAILNLDDSAEKLVQISKQSATHALETITDASYLTTHSSGMRLTVRKTIAPAKDSNPSNSKGITPTEIRIGMSSALTGPIGEIGSGMKNGIEACFSMINQQGGIHGRKLTLHALDDQYDPERALKNTKELIETHQVFSLIGYLGTATAIASLPEIEKENVPFLGPCTGSMRLRTPYRRNVFNLRASYHEEAEKIVEMLTQKLGLTNIGALIQADAYGSAGELAIHEALKRRKIEFNAKGFYERGTVNVGPAVERMKRSEAEAVILIGTYKASAAFVKLSREAGYDPIFVNISFVGASAFLREVGRFGENVICSQVVPPFEERGLLIAEEYRAAMKSSDFANLDFTSFKGFLIAKLLTEAIKASGKNLNREALISSLESGSVQLHGFALELTESSHKGSGEVWLTQIRGGRLQKLDIHSLAESRKAA